MRPSAVNLPVGPYRGDASDLHKDIRAKALACPREAEHNYGPHGYTAWHGWAGRCRAAAWEQVLCDCGLWLLLRRVPIVERFMDRALSTLHDMGPSTSANVGAVLFPELATGTATLRAARVLRALQFDGKVVYQRYGRPSGNWRVAEP